MSGPKHLWSGDWEKESGESTVQQVRAPRPRDPEPAPPTPPEPPRPRRTLRPWLLPVAVGAIAVVAAAFGLAKLLHSSSPGPKSTVGTLSPLARSAGAGDAHPIKWLGMELVTAAPGVPVVETVRPNSNGDRAGLEPGDAIIVVNNHPVGSTGSIAQAIKGLHSGDHVTLEVNNGGAVFQVVATLAAPPSPYP
jgi:membrane-associated protease RseP (regulator of RpoE activity)